jgi:phosphoheptose isomerase
MTQRRFVVLDRDGTINVERHYLSDPGQLDLFPGVAQGMHQMSHMGLGLVVITNQSGIGRGYFDPMRLELIHQRLRELLKAEDVHLDGIYICPHRPEEDCSCRKPRPGLLELAAKELDFDPKACFVIGDKACDIELGKRVGATTLLVRTGYGDQSAASCTLPPPDYVVDDLLAGANLIQQLLASGGTKEKMQPSVDQLRQRVRDHFFESGEVKQRIIESCVDSILAAVNLISETFRSGGKLLLCGNGGSAADCQHMAAEFVSRLTKDFDRPGLPAIALTTDTSFLTAFANDCGFEGIFERQIQALGKEGDVLIGISTSGNSANVVRAVKVAQAGKMRTIVLKGRGGDLEEMADVTISVPSTDTQYIQEAHLAIEHILCALVERDLFGQEKEVNIHDY